MRTVENALISAPVSDQVPIYIISSHRNLNMLCFDGFDDLSDFIRNGSDHKQDLCEFIEVRTDLFGFEAIFVYSVKKV